MSWASVIVGVAGVIAVAIAWNSAYSIGYLDGIKKTAEVMKESRNESAE